MNTFSFFIYSSLIKDGLNLDIVVFYDLVAIVSVSLYTILLIYSCSIASGSYSKLASSYNIVFKLVSSSALSFSIYYYNKL